MKLAYKAYQILSSGLFLLGFPPFWLYARTTGRYYAGLGQRLGCYSSEGERGLSGAPRIWMHAASVGEVTAAVPIIEALDRLMPGSALILSTNTDHGQALARAKLGSRARCVYAPVDFIVAVHRAMGRLRPDVLVCLETEIWPNWLHAAVALKVPVAIVNGRISVRSIRGYLKVRPLMAATLAQVAAFSMIRAEDAQRIQLLGAPRGRVAINGNAKYDLLVRQAQTSHQIEKKKLFNLKGDEPVLVAGSIRGNEDEIVLDAYEGIRQTFPATVLVIAPRHVQRAAQIKARVEGRGLGCQLRTELDSKAAGRSAPVVVVDTMGELQDIYSIASLVFCGGSLVPLGGQNVLEAAVWGKPVLYGPSMEDFLDAKALLDQTGGGVQVRSGPELAQQVTALLADPAALARIGAAARQAVLNNQGAAQRHAAVICDLLQGRIS